MWIDRLFFPWCPSCGEVVRVNIPPKGGRPRAVPPRCDRCGADRVFPPARWGWGRRLGFLAYLAVGWAVCWVWFLLLPVVALLCAVAAALGWRLGHPVRGWVSWLSTLVVVTLFGPAGRREFDVCEVGQPTNGPAGDERRQEPS
jgi:hypothetical protein